MADGIRVEVQETIGSKVEEPQKPVVKEVKTEEPKYVRLEDLEKINQAINNTREYNNRQLAELKAAIERIAPKEPVSSTVDEDELVQRDWKAGVEKVAERVVERVIHAKTTQTQEQLESQRINQILEESKRKVMEKHKELGDPNSEKTKEFLRVLEENPDFKTNPRGPILAAYEMENRLKAHDKIDLGETKVKEVRSRAATVPQGTPASNRSSYSLSKSDLDFCRLNNINPENYKRFKGLKEAQA